MKNFFTVGKWSAVLLLGASLLFAGCMGPSSSDDSAIPAKAGGMGANYVYKFSVDPQAGKLDIEPVVMGTAVQTTAFLGTIEITSSCAGAVLPLVCQITFKNLTPGQYMSRMRTWEYACPGADGCTPPTTATLTTSHTLYQIPGGATITQGADYGSGTGILADNTGVCIVEDGAWGHMQTTGSFDLDCPLLLYYENQFVSTLQFLHPECGSITDTWTFDGESTPYQFYTALTDTAAASSDGTAFGLYAEDGAGDGRFDPDRTTFVVKAYNLDNQWCATGTDCYAAYAYKACLGAANPVDGYALGAPGCSTPIAEGQTLAPGQYFAVNMGFEWPDRIENQTHGQRCKMSATAVTGPCNLSGLVCNEWPNSVSIVYTFDAAVLEAVTVTAITGGSTVLTVDANHEIYYGNKKSYADTNDGMNATPNYAFGENYVFIARAPNDASFAFKTAGFNLLTCIPSIRANTTARWGDLVQNYVGNGAVQDYRANADGMGSYGFTGLAEYFVNADSRCDTRDLAQDSAVDYWMGLHYMQVKPGAAAGSGSIIKAESNANNTTAQWFSSNCTRDGGMAGDDVTDWYWPCTGPPCDGTGSGTSTATLAEQDPGTYFYQAQEVSNKLMPGAFSAGGGKGYQVNSDHICVTP
ncbi:MAG: hypothetical protein A2V67_05735 [Deltaproteobacteria bacterium RBG_13_61_14]|nr:MAG: hypothetical protein A2V67_05735 [Deltaproteobacteria bacterium RBG_13_61_14]